MLRLSNLRNLTPPRNVFDYAYVTKNSAPTRAGTKRENWARFGSKRSRVDISEIVPTLQEYKSEHQAEKSWWPNRKQLENEVIEFSRNERNKNANTIKHMNEKLKKQKTYEKMVEAAKLAAKKEADLAEVQKRSEYALYDALGYKPDGGMQDEKLKRVKETLKNFNAAAKGGKFKPEKKSKKK